MLIGVWNYYETLHLNNFLLSADTSNVLGEDALQSFYEFTVSLDISKYQFKILDNNLSYKNYDKFIFFNYPKLNNKIVIDALNSKKSKYLFNFECPIIYPQSWNKEIYDKFDKIFTWNDDLIDNKKFIKINHPSFSKNRLKNLPRNHRDKLSVIVVSNKKSNHINDLYHKRLDVIKFYEQNAPNDLDFYGYGWSNYLFSGNKFLQGLNQINFLTKLLAKNFKIYKGAYYNDKINLLKNYKFSFCIENATGYNGYITEKIFHSFFSMTVPIYLGCPNITKYIPSTCFVDLRNFKNINELHLYIKYMSDEEYYKYLSEIENFLFSEKFRIFSNEFYIKTLKKNILDIN